MNVVARLSGNESRRLGTLLNVFVACHLLLVLLPYCQWCGCCMYRAEPLLWYTMAMLLQSMSLLLPLLLPAGFESCGAHCQHPVLHVSSPTHTEFLIVGPGVIPLYPSNQVAGSVRQAGMAASKGRDWKARTSISYTFMQ